MPRFKLTSRLLWLTACMSASSRCRKSRHTAACCLCPLSPPAHLHPLHSGTWGPGAARACPGPVELINLICLHLVYLSTVRNNCAEKSHDETVSEQLFPIELGSMSSFFPPHAKEMSGILTHVLLCYQLGGFSDPARHSRAILALRTRATPTGYEKQKR